MSLPTTGGQPTALYSATATWVPNINLIGDGENALGLNIDGEDDIANRSAKQLAQRSEYLYYEATRSDSSQVNAFSTIKELLEVMTDNKRIDHDLTITLVINENISNGPVEINGLYGRGSLTINLAGKTLNFTGTTSGVKAAFKIEQCSIPVTITNGIMDDSVSDLVEYMIYAKNCSGALTFEDLTTKFKSTGSGNAHYYFYGCPNVAVDSGDVSYGILGILATYNSHVVSITQTTTANVTSYGISSIYGSVVAKSGSQITGDTGDESSSAGGVIR